jgi:hypothetical protein
MEKSTTDPSDPDPDPAVTLPRSQLTSSLQVSAICTAGAGGCFSFPNVISSQLPWREVSVREEEVSDPVPAYANSLHSTPYFQKCSVTVVTYAAAKSEPKKRRGRGEVEGGGRVVGGVGGVGGWRVRVESEGCEGGG